MRKQCIFLEYRVDLSFIWRQLGDLNSVKQYLSAAWLLKAGNDPLRLLSFHSRWSQKRKEFVFVNVQINAPEHLLVIKVFCEIF